MAALARFLKDLSAHRPISWPPGAISAAWRACDDVDEMIEVLLKGAEVGVFEINETKTCEYKGTVERWLFRLGHAGRFYRIDVRREAGAEAVRRCFPDFPDDWASSLVAALGAMDPLDRLCSDLRNGRPISGDREAAQRAWLGDGEPFTMLSILRLLGQPIPELPRSHGGGLAAYEEGKRRMRDAIRAAYPRLPID